MTCTYENTANSGSRCQAIWLHRPTRLPAGHALQEMKVAVIPHALLRMCRTFQMALGHPYRLEVIEVQEGGVESNTQCLTHQHFTAATSALRNQLGNAGMQCIMHGTHCREF